jgi:hypothetical protein
MQNELAEAKRTLAEATQSKENCRTNSPRRSNRLPNSKERLAMKKPTETPATGATDAG